MYTLTLLLSAMLTGLQHAHKGLRTAIVIIILVTIGSSLAGWLKKGPYTQTNKLFALIAMTLAHLQLLLGLGLYFMSPRVSTGETYWKWEHPTMMLLAIIAFTMGYSAAKRKTNDIDKHKTTFIYFCIGTLIVIFTLSKNHINLLF